MKVYTLQEENRFLWYQIKEKTKADNYEKSTFLLNTE